MVFRNKNLNALFAQSCLQRSFDEGEKKPHDEGEKNRTIRLFLKAK